MTDREQTIQEPPTKLAALEAQRDKLIDRLDTGAVRIQEGRAEGKDVSSWETFWLGLLRQYESVCNQIRDCIPPAA